MTNRSHAAADSASERVRSETGAAESMQVPFFQAFSAAPNASMLLLIEISLRVARMFDQAGSPRARIDPWRLVEE